MKKFVKFMLYVLAAILIAYLLMFVGAWVDFY